MSAYEDNSQNIHNPEEEHRATYWERVGKGYHDFSNRTDKAWHDSENFLYRHRWGIVLLLAIILAVVLFMKRDKVSSTFGTSTMKPMLGGGYLNIASPPNPNIGSDAARIWGF